MDDGCRLYNGFLNYVYRCWGLDIWAVLGVVAESVEREPLVREIGSSVPRRVKSMTYKIDTCHFLPWWFVITRIGQELVRSASGKWDKGYQIMVATA